jgi:hypothetical protein
MASNTSQIYSVTSFGPTTSREFDFTPLFEDIFLSIVPSVLLLLAVPFRMLSLYRKPRKVQWSALHDHKLVSDISLVKSQVSLSLVTTIIFISGLWWLNKWLTREPTLYTSYCCRSNIGSLRPLSFDSMCDASKITGSMAI